MSDEDVGKVTSLQHATSLFARPFTDKLTTLPIGASVFVLEQRAEINRWRVKTPAGVGWVFLSANELRNARPATPAEKEGAYKAVTKEEKEEKEETENRAGYVVTIGLSSHTYDLDGSVKRGEHSAESGHKVLLLTGKKGDHAYYPCVFMNNMSLGSVCLLEGEVSGGVPATPEELAAALEVPGATKLYTGPTETPAKSYVGRVVTIGSWSGVRCLNGKMLEEQGDGAEGNKVLLLTHGKDANGFYPCVYLKTGLLATVDLYTSEAESGVAATPEELAAALKVPGALDVYMGPLPTAEPVAPVLPTPAPPTPAPPTTDPVAPSLSEASTSKGALGKVVEVRVTSAAGSYEDDRGEHVDVGVGSKVLLLGRHTKGRFKVLVLGANRLCSVGLWAKEIRSARAATPDEMLTALSNPQAVKALQAIGGVPWNKDETQPVQSVGRVVTVRYTAPGYDLKGVRLGEIGCAGSKLLLLSSVRHRLGWKVFWLGHNTVGYTALSVTERGDARTPTTEEFAELLANPEATKELLGKVEVQPTKQSVTASATPALPAVTGHIGRTVKLVTASDVWGFVDDNYNTGRAYPPGEHVVLLGERHASGRFPCLRLMDSTLCSLALSEEDLAAPRPTYAEHMAYALTLPRAQGRFFKGHIGKVVRVAITSHFLSGATEHTDTIPRLAGSGEDVLLLSNEPAIGGFVVFSLSGNVVGRTSLIESEISTQRPATKEELLQALHNPYARQVLVGSTELVLSSTPPPLPVPASLISLTDEKLAAYLYRTKYLSAVRYPGAADAPGYYPSLVGRVVMASRGFAAEDLQGRNCAISLGAPLLVLKAEQVEGKFTVFNLSTEYVCQVVLTTAERGKHESPSQHNLLRAVRDPVAYKQMFGVEKTPATKPAPPEKPAPEAVISLPAPTTGSMVGLFVRSDGYHRSDNGGIEDGAVLCLLSEPVDRKAKVRVLSGYNTHAVCNVVLTAREISDARRRGPASRVITSTEEDCGIGSGAQLEILSDLMPCEHTYKGDPLYIAKVRVLTGPSKGRVEDKYHISTKELCNSKVKIQPVEPAPFYVYVPTKNGYAKCKVLAKNDGEALKELGLTPTVVAICYTGPESELTRTGVKSSALADGIVPTPSTPWFVCDASGKLVSVTAGTSRKYWRSKETPEGLRYSFAGKPIEDYLCHRFTLKPATQEPVHRVLSRIRFGDGSANYAYHEDLPSDFDKRQNKSTFDRYLEYKTVCSDSGRLTSRSEADALWEMSSEQVTKVHLPGSTEFPGGPRMHIVRYTGSGDDTFYAAVRSNNAVTAAEFVNSDGGRHAVGIGASELKSGQTYESFWKENAKWASVRRTYVHGKVDYQHLPYNTMQDLELQVALMCPPSYIQSELSVRQSTESSDAEGPELLKKSLPAITQCDGDGRTYILRTREPVTYQLFYANNHVDARRVSGLPADSDCLHAPTLKKGEELKAYFEREWSIRQPKPRFATRRTFADGSYLDFNHTGTLESAIESASLPSPSASKIEVRSVPHEGASWEECISLSEKEIPSMPTRVFLVELTLRNHEVKYGRVPAANAVAARSSVTALHGPNVDIRVLEASSLYAHLEAKAAWYAEARDMKIWAIGTDCGGLQLSEGVSAFDAFQHLIDGGEPLMAAWTTRDICVSDDPPSPESPWTIKKWKGAPFTGQHAMEVFSALSTVHRITSVEELRALDVPRVPDTLTPPEPPKEGTVTMVTATTKPADPTPTTWADDSNAAAWRVASVQLVRLAKEPFLAILSKSLAPGDDAFRERLRLLLDTEMGNALMSAILAIALTSAGSLGIPLAQGAQPEKLAHELRVSSMAITGDLLADLLVGPVMQVVTTYLRAVPEVVAEVAPPAEATPLALGDGTRLETISLSETTVPVKVNGST